MYMFRFYMNLVNFDLKLNLQTSKVGLTNFLVVIKQLFVRVGKVWVEGYVFALAPLTSWLPFKDLYLQKMYLF